MLSKLRTRRASFIGDLKPANIAFTAAGAHVVQDISPSQLVIVVNWLEELKRRVPTR